jgi:hypothetical protein
MRLAGVLLVGQIFLPQSLPPLNLRHTGTDADSAIGQESGSSGVPGAVAQEMRVHPSKGRSRVSPQGTDGLGLALT